MAQGELERPEVTMNVKMVLVVQVKVNLDRWREEYGMADTATARTDALTYLPEAVSEMVKSMNSNNALPYEVASASTHGLPVQAV